MYEIILEVHKKCTYYLTKYIINEYNTLISPYIMYFKKIKMHCHLKKRCDMKYEKREQKTLQSRIERFIELGKEKHGENRYDYSLAREEYINNHTPVPLICIDCVCVDCKDKPFLVYPFAHTDKGDNKKGTCKYCYVSKLNVQETRWNPNLKDRINEFRERMYKRHGIKYSYPHLDKEYKNESSVITVVVFD